MYEITIPIKPQAKERARRGANKNWYTPGNTEVAENIIKLYGFDEIKEPIVGPVILEVWFLFQKNDISPDEDLPHFIKPDSDNLTKLIKDSLEKIAFKNDCQVSDEHIYKRWSNENAIFINIMPWRPNYFIINPIGV